MQRNPWLEGGGERGAHYDRRFAELAAAGHDVHGEARFVASLGVGSVLDAGCGTGRVAIELARSGIDVEGVDLDPAMLEAARVKAPSLRFVEGDLATVDLGRRFEAVVVAGNVMIFLTAGSEEAVLANMARHLDDGGLLVAGFSLGGGRLDLETYDRLAEGAGLVLAERWSTWEREVFLPTSTYAVSVHRKLPASLSPRRSGPPA